MNTRLLPFLLALAAPLVFGDRALAGERDATSDAPTAEEVLPDVRAFTAQVCACHDDAACLAPLEPIGLALVERLWATEAGELGDELYAVWAELERCAPTFAAALEAAAKAAALQGELDRFVDLGGLEACENYVAGGERFGLEAVGDEAECIDDLLPVIELCGDNAGAVYACIATVEADAEEAWVAAIEACVEVCF